MLETDYCESLRQMTLQAELFLFWNARQIEWTWLGLSRYERVTTVSMERKKNLSIVQLKKNKKKSFNNQVLNE